jgi:hypothetical protein
MSFTFHLSLSLIQDNSPQQSSALCSDIGLEVYHPAMPNRGYQAPIFQYDLRHAACEHGHSSKEHAEYGSRQ